MMEAGLTAVCATSQPARTKAIVHTMRQNISVWAKTWIEKKTKSATQSVHEDGSRLIFAKIALDDLTLPPSFIQF
jgi:hypothetical protein